MFVTVRLPWKISRRIEKSKICYLVEHVFGFEEQSMFGLVAHTVDLVSARANVTDQSCV